MNVIELTVLSNYYPPIIIYKTLFCGNEECIDIITMCLFVFTLIFMPVPNINSSRNVLNVP